MMSLSLIDKEFHKKFNESTENKILSTMPRPKTFTIMY